MDIHREQMLRGYLAMLVVEKPYRSLGTGVNCLLMSLSKHLQLQGICLCCEKHDMHDDPKESELPSRNHLACINGVTVLKLTDSLLQSKTCMCNAECTEFSENSAFTPMLATPVPRMQVFPVMQAQS